MQSMNLQNQEEEKNPEIKQTTAWENLTHLERNCVIALLLSNSVREAEKKFTAMTGKKNWVFWKEVYPAVRETWKAYADNISDLALGRLKAGSLEAVDEMIDEIKHFDVEIRHKASKVIIENVVTPKKESSKGPTFNAPVQINVDKYKMP